MHGKELEFSCHIFLEALFFSSWFGNLQQLWLHFKIFDFFSLISGHDHVDIGLGGSIQPAHLFDGQ